MRQCGNHPNCRCTQAGIAAQKLRRTAANLAWRSAAHAMAPDGGMRSMYRPGIAHRVRAGPLNDRFPANDDLLSIPPAIDFAWRPCHCTC